MEDQTTQAPPRQQASVFVPSLLVVIALLVMTGFQTIQLDRERDLMNTRIVQQEEPLKESETVRKQWDSGAGVDVVRSRDGGVHERRRSERRP